jgi:hypothetical protein
MSDKKTEAQKFMNQHSLKECYECDGQLYKHRSNAEGRRSMSGKEIIIHTANAGAAGENPIVNEEN